MENYYKEYIDKLKTQPREELERQRAHHFQNRRLSSTDFFELNDGEIKHREILDEQRKSIKLNIWTFVVALLTLVLALAEIILKLIRDYKLV
jgi:hypothetical protein